MLVTITHAWRAYFPPLSHSYDDQATGSQRGVLQTAPPLRLVRLETQGPPSGNEVSKPDQLPFPRKYDVVFHFFLVDRRVCWLDSLCGLL